MLVTDAASLSCPRPRSVRWFNSKKGFGFITPKDGSDEVFVHQSAILADGFRSLAEKEIVEYDLDKDDEGRAKAINVTGPAGAPVKGAPKPRPRYYNRKDGAAPAGADGQPAAPVAAAAAGAPVAAAATGDKPAPKAKKEKAAPAAAAAAAAAPTK